MQKYLTLIISEMQAITNVGKNVKKGEYLCTVSGIKNRYSNYERQYGSSLEN